MRVFAAVAVLSLFAGCVAAEKITASKPANLTTSQVNQIKQVVTYDFFDPSSAQFRNIRAADVTLASGKVARRVCGEVNGKNRVGGYVGFSLFGGTIEGGKFVRADFFGPCEPW